MPFTCRWLIFDEVAGKTTGQIIGFIIGIFFVVTGILSLLFRKKEEAVVLSVSESAARVSAAVTLMADVARLRRVHSSPGDLRLYKDAQLAHRTGKQLDFGVCRMRQLHVPLYSPRTTRVEARLVATQDADCRPVSPRRLLKAPQPEILTPEDARRALSDRPRVAQALLVDALLPGSTALLSEPYRNRRFKATLAAAEAAALVEQPSSLADLREEEDLRRARFATFAFPLGMPEVPESPAADVTSVPVRHDAVQRSATLARHYASIRSLVMPTEGVARSITDVRERLQHRHKYSSLRLNAFSTDVGMATPTELGACPLAHDAARAGAMPAPCGATSYAPAVVVPIVSPETAIAAAAAFKDASSPGAPAAPLPAGAEGATRVVQFAPSPQGMAGRRMGAGVAGAAAAPERPPSHRRFSTSSDVLAHNGRGAFGVYTRHAATAAPPHEAARAPVPPVEMLAGVPITTAAPSEGELFEGEAGSSALPAPATQPKAFIPPARGRRDRFSATERLAFLRGLHSSEARLPSGRLMLLTEGANAPVAATGFSGNASVPLPLPQAAERQGGAARTDSGATTAEEAEASTDALVAGGPTPSRTAPTPGTGADAEPASGPTPTPVPSPTRVLHEPASAEHPLQHPTAVHGLQRLKGPFQRTVFRSERRNREPPLRAVPEEPTYMTTPTGAPPASMAGTGAGGEVAGAPASAATAVTITTQPAPPAAGASSGGADAGAALPSWLRRITRRGSKSMPPPLRTTNGEEQTAAEAVAGTGAGGGGGGGDGGEGAAAGMEVASARPRCVESVILIPLAVLETQKIDPALLAAVLRARKRTETVYQQRRQLYRLRARREARRQEHMGRRWLRHAHRRVAACFGMTVPPPPQVVDADGNAVSPQDVDTGSPELTWTQRRDREAELASVTGRLKERAAVGLPAGADSRTDDRVSTAHVPLSLIPFADDTYTGAAERKEAPAPAHPLPAGLPAGSFDIPATDAGAAKAEPVVDAAGASVPQLFGAGPVFSAPSHIPSALPDTSSIAQAPSPQSAAARGDTSIPIHNAV